MVDPSNQQSRFTQQHPHPSIGIVPSTNQMPYATSVYQTTPMMGSGAPPPSPTQPPTTAALASYHQAQHYHNNQQQQQQLQSFWANQMQEVEQTMEFKNHSLPLARIKKIMKADEDVRMISAEAPVVFAKACEMFILELTLRSWIHTEENKRRTLQKNDIAAAISRTDVFDFLVDIIPRDELKEEGLGGAAIPTDGIPYYYAAAGQPPTAPLQFMAAWPPQGSEPQPE